MRLAAIGVALCLGIIPAQAQQLPQAPSPWGPAPGVSLKLSVEQTKLIVQTLGAIGCQSVTQLAMCNDALALLKDIQAQAREQMK